MTFGPVNAISNSLPIEIQLPKDQNDVNSVFAERHRIIADVVNLKENAQYEENELLTAQRWFTANDNQTKRYTYRKVLETGVINAGATANIAHGITGISLFTKICGCCVTATPDYRPIPYASATAVNQQIEMNVTAANVVIINGAAAPQITSGVIILEYIKA